MIKFYDDPEDFKNNKIVCNAWVATAVIGAGVLGAGATIYASGKASDAQKDAANAGIDATTRMYNQTRSDLTPYRTAGEGALTTLNEKLPYLTSPIELTQDWLESTPGYKFTRDQGLKATQNSAAARGLGVSGAALKGAANFATGLADNTYKTQVDVENLNRTNTYNRLKSLVDTGQSAAAQTSSAGTSAGKDIASLNVGAGNAAAAGYNAAGGAVSKLANDVGGYYAYKGLYGGGSNGNWAAANPGVNGSAYYGPVAP